MNEQNECLNKVPYGIRDEAIFRDTEADKRVRRFMTPKRILWMTQTEKAEVTGAEALLKPHVKQIHFNVPEQCRLESKGKSAGILLDFGVEFHGYVKLYIHSVSPQRVRLRIRFGESASEAMAELGIKAFTASTQIYTRKQDLRIMEVLSKIACTLAKFSLDFRILQSPPIGEFSEPFGKHQVGSSAMPFKRNPINSEKIDSLSRLVSSAYSAAWQNASMTILERSLDDSANRRVFIPESFIALDEMLMTEIRIVKGMNIHSAATKRLMESYGIFSATERVLMEAGKKGADRQEMHEVIRELSLKAWEKVQNGEANPLRNEMAADNRILEYLTKDEILSLLDASSYTGEAEKRTMKVVQEATRPR